MRYILAAPIIIGFVIWAIKYTANPSPETVEEAGELIVQAAIPWWLPIIQFFSSYDIFGAVVIIGVLLFIVKK